MRSANDENEKGDQDVHNRPVAFPHTHYSSATAYIRQIALSSA
jgi:hypothetical protein